LRYQITQTGWSVGDRLIPNGTVIDTNGNDDWSKLAGNRPPPLNAQPLDQAAWTAMKSIDGSAGRILDGQDFTRWIVTGFGVVRS
jgi:hypothetical protein